MNFFSSKRAEQEHRRWQNRFTKDDLGKVVSRGNRLKSMFLKHGRLSAYYDESKILMSMLSDYYHRRYTAVPWYIISSVGATLLYVLTPVDLVPDFIPFVGFVDDATIFGVCLNLVRSELKKYSKSLKKGE
jgi:uncharacterized membrane protein YkvA (DUF1232 family)